jgi:hypothetical protein
VHDNNEAELIIDEIDRLIAWHAPVALPVGWTASPLSRLAKGDPSDAVAAVRRRLEVH